VNAPLAITSPRELEKAANDAITAKLRFDAYQGNDREWDRLCRESDEATLVFQSTLHRAGISKGLMAALIGSGVVA